MGTTGKEYSEGRHSKQKEIIMLFFFLSVLQLKTTLKRHVSTEPFTLPNKRAFLSSFLPLPSPSLDVWLEKNYCRHCLAATTTESLLETSWVRFMSAHRKKERKGEERGGDGEEKAPSPDK